MHQAKNSAILSAYALLFTFAFGVVGLEIYSSTEEEPIVSELRLRQIAATSIRKQHAEKAAPTPAEEPSSSRIAANRHVSETP